MVMHGGVVPLWETCGFPVPGEVTAVAHSEHSSPTGTTATVVAMSTEQTQTPQWGAPPPPAQPRPKWSAKRTVIAVAVAVGIAAAGGAAIYAASGSVTADQGPGGGGGPVIMGGPLGGDSGTDHGEFQSGEVTEITDDSITAKSDDGYTKTYTIDADTKLADDVEKGDEVTIIATTEGDTATARSVMERGAMPQRRGGPPQNDSNDTPPDDGN